MVRIDIVNTSIDNRPMGERHRIGGTDFVWDLGKADTNLRKHGISFEDAATVFFEPLFALVGASRKG